METFLDGAARQSIEMHLCTPATTRLACTWSNNVIWCCCHVITWLSRSMIIMVHVVTVTDGSVTSVMTISRDWSWRIQSSVMTDHDGSVITWRVWCFKSWRLSKKWRRTSSVLLWYRMSYSTIRPLGREPRRGNWVVGKETFRPTLISRRWNMQNIIMNTIRVYWGR